MNEKYDLEIVLAVHLGGIYLQRLIDFKKYGLINVGSKKILLSLLVGTTALAAAAETDLLSLGWPESVDVVVHRYQIDDVTRKTYSYFSQYPNDPNTIRWCAKFDDDSMNDITSLVNMLDEEYDYQKEYYLVTEIRNEMPQGSPEEKLLKKLGYERWFIHDKKLHHEYEGCVISQATLKKIMATPVAIELMKIRSEINGGFSDICLAAAARLAGVYPVAAYFLSKDPIVGEFSLFGGNLAHIHFISHDNNSSAFNLVVEAIDQPFISSSDENIIKTIQEKDYIFGQKGNSKVFQIKLGELNKITNSPHANETLWRYRNDALEFITINGAISTRFDLVSLHKNNFNYAEGLFKLNKENYIHFIRALT